MSTTYTPTLNSPSRPSATPAGRPRSTPTADALDGLAPVGGLCVTLAEVPSASLNVAVAAGDRDRAGRLDRQLRRHEPARQSRPQRRRSSISTARELGSTVGGQLPDRPRTSSWRPSSPARPRSRASPTTGSRSTSPARSPTASTWRSAPRPGPRSARRSRRNSALERDPDRPAERRGARRDHGFDRLERDHDAGDGPQRHRGPHGERRRRTTTISCSRS